MKKGSAFGIIAGFVVGAATAVAGAVAVDKVTKEIKSDVSEQIFTSPEGNNTVTVSFGSSKTAGELACIKIIAASESKEDFCKLIAFAKKKADFLSGEWSDNDHFRLLIGTGKRKQCCDISFENDEIVANYYLNENFIVTRR